MSNSNYQDVIDFHNKFGLKYKGKPISLDKPTQAYRAHFLEEEMTEFITSANLDDVVGMADALVDIVYVAMGTAYMMGLPWQKLWNEVHTTNMNKVRTTNSEQSKRKNLLDVIKPEGWQPPNLKAILDEQ
jgi:predicted HAD superfamily Cof-like phosphohydrolase